jgi:hypothetical protein
MRSTMPQCALQIRQKDRATRVVIADILTERTSVKVANRDPSSAVHFLSI